MCLWEFHSNLPIWDISVQMKTHSQLSSVSVCSDILSYICPCAVRSVCFHAPWSEMVSWRVLLIMARRSCSQIWHVTAGQRLPPGLSSKLIDDCRETIVWQETRLRMRGGIFRKTVISLDGTMLKMLLRLHSLFGEPQSCQTLRLPLGFLISVVWRSTWLVALPPGEPCPHHQLSSSRLLLWTSSCPASLTGFAPAAWRRVTDLWGSWHQAALKCTGTWSLLLYPLPQRAKKEKNTNKKHGAKLPSLNHVRWTG